MGIRFRAQRKDASKPPTAPSTVATTAISTVCQPSFSQTGRS